MVVSLWNKAEGVCVSFLTACKWSQGTVLMCISMFVYVGELMCIYKYTRTCIHMHMKARRICYTSILPSTFFFKKKKKQALSLASVPPRMLAWLISEPQGSVWLHLHSHETHTQPFYLGSGHFTCWAIPSVTLFFFFFAEIKGPDMLPWQQVVIHSISELWMKGVPGRAGWLPGSVHPEHCF